MKTPELKALAGTSRPSRAKAATIDRLSSVPAAPSHLSPDARREWDRLAPQAVVVGIAAADLRAFELLCETLAQADQLAKIVRDEGVTIMSAGAIKAHPALAAGAQARKDASAMLGRFGLDPKGRTALPPPPAAQRHNPFTALSGGKDRA